ncbi:MAG: tRNA pseudouridine(55) synthase TruB [Candidatus Dojkabacteria bacterium]
MIDGILIIDKEVGITSYDVIRKLKRVSKKGQKIGHGGTLDPFASGVLLVLLGKATKLMERVLLLEKEYIVKAEFGYITDTQDIEGEVLQRCSLIPKYEDIKDAIQRNFVGDILQTPPIYSAKRIGGKRAYDLAREGVKPEIEPKRVHVEKFEILKYEYPYIECKILCSSGTYIRTLISDLGRELGAYATAVELRRTSIGNFSVEDALSSKLIDEGVYERVIDVSKVSCMLNGE